MSRKQDSRRWWGTGIFSGAVLAFALAGRAQTNGFAEIKAQAEAGEAQAQFVLGTMFERGEGVARDQAQAYRWLSSAADQGHTLAALELARIYESGSAIPVDAAKSLRNYLVAADAGHEAAVERLARVYKNGELGEEREPVLEVLWTIQLRIIRHGKGS